MFKFNFSFGKGVKGSGVVASERREGLDGFRNMDVGGAFEVEAVAKRDFAVEVEADDNILPLVEVYVSGDVLKIKSSKRINSRNPVRVRVSAPEFDSIDASGAARVNVVDLAGGTLSIDASGASKIILVGTVNELTADVSGASSLDGRGLKAGTARIDASGASSADVDVSERIVASASGASRIGYSGNPATIDQNASGAGKVFRR